MTAGRWRPLLAALVLLVLIGVFIWLAIVIVKWLLIVAAVLALVLLVGWVARRF